MHGSLLVLQECQCTAQVAGLEAKAIAATGKKPKHQQHPNEAQPQIAACVHWQQQQEAAHQLAATAAPKIYTQSAAWGLKPAQHWPLGPCPLCHSLPSKQFSSLLLAEANLGLQQITGHSTPLASAPLSGRARLSIVNGIGELCGTFMFCA